MSGYCVDPLCSPYLQTLPMPLVVVQSAVVYRFLKLSVNLVFVFCSRMFGSLKLYDLVKLLFMFQGTL